MIQHVERYTIDPERISLQLFYERTRSKKLIPSRITLQDGIEGYFEALTKMGIHNLKQLIASLGNKEKIKNVSNKTGIPGGYLTLLKREAGSYLSKPFALSGFPGIPLEYTEVLKSRGIRNTREFFESVQSDQQRKQMAEKTGIPEARLRELFSLCDLSRITGVGGFYARILYQSGIRSVHDFTATDSATLHRKYMEILEKRGYPVQPLGEDDLQYCIDYATILAEQNPIPHRT
jgi:hypothetical protein